MTSLYPLLASDAPAAFRYGVYGISAIAFAYVFGVRSLLRNRDRNDVGVALVILSLTGGLGFVLLSTVSLEAILSYLYGFVLGAAVVYTSGSTAASLPRNLSLAGWSEPIDGRG